MTRDGPCSRTVTAARGGVSPFPPEVTPCRLGNRGAPALLARPAGVEPRAIVLVLPGGGLAFDKRWALEWLPLEGLPVLRAYVDLPLHGERLVPDLRERFRFDRIRGFFGPAILGMAAEIPSILDDLFERAGNPSLRRVGLCGWSIGGLAAFLAALKEPRVGPLAGFAIPGGGVDHLRLMERPPDPAEAALLRDLDLLDQAGDLYPRPVLLMHGSDDTWVRPTSSRTLYRVLASAYRDRLDRVRYEEFPGVPHDPLEADADRRRAIAGAARRWMATHLLRPPSPDGDDRPAAR